MWSSLREPEDGAGFWGCRKEEGSRSNPRVLAGMNWVDSVGTLERKTSFPHLLRGNGDAIIFYHVATEVSAGLLSRCVPIILGFTSHDFSCL